MNTLAPANGAGSWSLFPARMTFFLAILYLWMLALPFVRPLFSQSDAGAYLGFIPFSLFLAMLTASTAREIATHPFSFTLPLHRHLLRRQLLTIGAAGNALFMLPMLLYPAATGAGKAGAMLAFFCAGAALYLGAALLIFRLRDSVWLSGPLMLTGFLLVVPPNLRSTVLAQHLSGHPLLFLLLAALVLLPFWQMFDDKGRFRRLPGASSLSVVDGMDMRKYREFRYLLEMESRSGTVEPAWQGWLAGLARGTPYGWLYCFRHQLLQRLAAMAAAATPGRFVPHMLALALTAWLVSRDWRQDPQLYLMAMNLVFSMWMLNLARVDAHNPLLPYSRRAMAVADFLLGVVASMLWVVVTIAFLVVCWFMGAPAQDGLVPVLAATIGFATLFMPLYLGLRFLFRGGLGFGWFVLLIPLQILSRVLFDDYQRADAITLLLLHAGGWLLLVPAVYWRYCRTDLVSNAA